MRQRKSKTSFTRRSPRKAHQRGKTATGEERFRDLIEQLSVGVVLLNSRAEVQYANHAAADMCGIPASESVGKTTEEMKWEIVREDGSPYPFAMRPVPRSIASGLPVRGEVMGHRRADNGQVCWMYSSAVPQLGSDGSVRQVIMTVTDITDRKNIEEELRELSARLLGLQEEERRRIARDLHDSFAQRLVAIGLNLAQLTKTARKWSAGERRALAEARKMSKILLRQARSLSYLLHPPYLDGMGLAAAIREYAAGYSRRSGIQLELDLPADLDALPAPFESAIFRVIQEALGNIQKHSGSITGAIRIRKDAHQITVEVSDKGRGISRQGAEGAGPLGVGILGMRERMRQLGGALDIAPANPGTMVRAILPFRREVRDASPNPARR